MDAIGYERAIFEYLLYEFQLPFFKVDHNVQVRGRFSDSLRQIDVAVWRAGRDTPFLVAEAKHHGRKVEIGHIEAFVTKLQDIDAKVGMMFASSDYSQPGRRIADNFGIELFVMPIENALRMSWRSVARQIFPMDWAFHPQMAEGLYLLQRGEEPEKIIDAIDGSPFEEWESFVQYALSCYQEEVFDFLWFIANHHFEADWRYNALAQLIDARALGRFNIEPILEKEVDVDILDLLDEYRQI